MSNYDAICRSNNFQVKDRDAFLSEMKQYKTLVVDETPRGFLVYVSTDGEGWPSYVDSEDNDDMDEINIFAIIGKHLEDDEVAIFMEVGHQKLVYVGGYAVAINNRLEERCISLDEIFYLGKGLTTQPERVNQF